MGVRARWQTADWDGSHRGPKAGGTLRTFPEASRSARETKTAFVMSMMQPTYDNRTAWSHRWSAIVAVAAVVALACPAAAQQVLVMVNGEPITSYDVDQRAKFHLLSTHKASPRQAVIDELINEKLKVQVVKRYKIDITDKDVESSFSDMARRMRLSPSQLTQVLAQSGVDANTLKARIRADISWQQIVRGKFQSSFQIRDKDINDALEKNNKAEDKDMTGVEYSLRPILFVVTGGRDSARIDTRKREAEALRARFNTCDEGLPFARALRGVVVRDPIKKNSGDLAPVLRKILDDTPVGKLTAPEVTPNGVELFAVCDRKETKIESAAKRQIREQLFTERFEAQSQRYIQELRRSAMIEVK
jgi:peptidyl-prolyl cis-trans isomerase SurA